MKFNKYRWKRLGEKFFLTTDSGTHITLSKPEFTKLKEENFDDKLQRKLEDANILLTEENMDKAASLLQKRYSFLLHGPSLHIIVVTLRCDMNCIYCHASSKPVSNTTYDMDKDTAKKSVDFIFGSPNKNITIEFQGGEPLLNWNIVKYIIEYAKEKNIAEKKNLSFAIVSNFTNMDEQKMDFLVKNDIGVCTSLDGPKELHNYNRHFINGSNYDQVVHWIKRFNEEYTKQNMDNKHINALCTLTRKSLAYPKEIIDEYINLNLTSIHLRFLNNLGIAKKSWGKLSYSVEDYLNFWKKSVAYMSNLKNKGVKISERMTEIMLEKIRGQEDPGYLDLRSPCGAAIGQIAYNYNGDIYSCDEARMVEGDIFILGNVKKNNYSEIITGRKALCIVNASINDQYICDDCAYKPYCGICPVCNYSEQGTLIGKISMTDRCKIYKEQFDYVVKENFINKEPKLIN
jgi:His-Xaa-Ser system radical SAM maturase HxsB